MAFLRERSARPALILWGLLALATIVKVLASPDRHHFPFFRSGALNWFSGVSPYALEGNLVFRYSPTFAVLTGPFALFPLWLGNILWNLTTLGLLFWAVLLLSRNVLPGSWTPRSQAALLMLSVPGVIRTVSSSQSHGLSAACLFLGLVAGARGRWWPAGLLFAAAFYIKLAPLALGLILVALWPRRLGPPYLAGLVGLGLLPFLTQHPGFVVAEYATWLGHLGESSASRWPSFRDVWHVWELSGLPFNPTGYRALQLGSGAATLVWCVWLSRAGLARGPLLTASFAMGTCYLLLFGPAVEFNQYVLIAPFIAWAVLHGERRWVALVAYFMTLILGFGRMERLLQQLVDSPLVTAISTLGTLLFAAWLIAHFAGVARASSGRPAGRLQAPSAESP